jgi:hypothetical protein
VDVMMSDTDIAELLADRTRLERELASAKAALSKIDAIRNSIVGRQNIDWSMHIYPLVAALDEAGFSGEGYAVARQKAEAEVQARSERERRLRRVADAALAYRAAARIDREDAAKELDDALTALEED